MLTTKKVMQHVSFVSNAAGGAVSIEARNALQQLRNQQSIIFFVLFVIVLSVSILGPIIISIYQGEPGLLIVIGSATGVTVAGGIEIMRRVWREWSQATLLMILMEDASEDQIATLVDKLAQKL